MQFWLFSQSFSKKIYDVVEVVFVIFEYSDIIFHLCLEELVEYTDILFTSGEFLSRWLTSLKRILSALSAKNLGQVMFAE